MSCAGLVSQCAVTTLVSIRIRSSVDAVDYIQLYDGNADTLRESLHCIQVTAKTILSALPLETTAAAAQETSFLYAVRACVRVERSCRVCYPRRTSSV